jgi:hypothetical protein
MGYTVAQIEEIAGKLKLLPDIDPPQKDLSKADAVKMLAKEIKSLQKRGYSLEQIANSLKGEGLDIATPTLKSYLQKIKAPATKPKANGVKDKQISPVVEDAKSPPKADDKPKQQVSKPLLIPDSDDL